MIAPVPHAVFISYARHASRAHAEALHQVLARDGVGAFLDTADIEAGAPWPEQLAEAILASRVVVIFAEDGYFERLSCWRELRAALAPVLTSQGQAQDLSGLVVALPGGNATAMEALPPQLRNTQWPRADDPLALSKLIREALATQGSTLGERLDALGASRSRTARQLLEELGAPPPAALEAGVRQFPVQVPPSLGNAFVGRADELWRIDFVLRSRDPLHSTSTLVLHGGGGTGKTRLALEYLHRYGRHYPGGVFWIDADASEERLEEQLHEVLRALRPDVPELALFRKQQRKVADELARALRDVPAGQPVLYIVDNLPEPEGANQPRPLKEWCPGIGRVSLLVTSRLRPTAAGIAVQSIEPLHPEPAMLMLTHDLSEPAVGEEDWLSVTQWVGHLPLALELLNRAIHLGGLTPGELVQKARHARPAPELDQQMDALRSQVEPNALRGITEAFSLSYERLPERARKAARLVARLSPEPIPVMLLEALGPEASAANVRSDLVSRAFVTRVPGREGVQLFGRMHRLLADFLLGRADDPDGELLQVGKAVAKAVSADECRDVAAWPTLQAWLPHAEAVYAPLRQRTPPLDARLEICLGLLMELYLAERGALGQAMRLGTDMLERGQAALGPEHQDVLALLNNHTLVLKQLGDVRGAIANGKRLVEISRRVLGPDSPDTLTAMGNLASALFDEGYYKQALSLKEEVLALKTVQLGPDHPECLAALNNFALSLGESGEEEEAAELHEHVFQRSREVLGPDHSGSLLAAINLAQSCLSLKKVKRAVELLEDAIARLQKSHGSQHPSTLLARSTLATALFLRGAVDPAIRLQEEVLGIGTAAFGEDHPDTISSLHQLAHLLEKSGDPERARGLREKALRCCLQRYGEGHRETLTAMNLLVSVFNRLGLADEERAMLEQLLQTILRHRGEEHPGTLSAMSQLAEFYRLNGELSLARELAGRAVSAWAFNHGDADVMTTLAAWSYLQILRDLHDADACEEVYNRHLRWLLIYEPEDLEPLQLKIREQLRQQGHPFGSSHAVASSADALPITELERITSEPFFAPPRAGIKLYFLVGPMERGAAYEQARAFLLGKLLSRGIRRGEAVARVERCPKEYRVRFALMTTGEEKEGLGTLAVPLQGLRPKNFTAKLKAAGITVRDDASITVVTRRAWRSAPE